MSGHSKWATTKRKKAVIDAKRGKLFAKLVKSIEVAARLGGPDPDGNPALYEAIQTAKKSSLPNDNIDRAIKRGSGQESGGANWEPMTYEAYGPEGVAILIECLTDNRNRSASDVRVAVTRQGGTMADVGSVARLFTRKGIVELAKKQGSAEISDDNVMEAALEAGLEDVADNGDTWAAYCDPNDLVGVRKAIEAAGYEYDSAEVGFVPSFEQLMDSVESARKLFKIIDALEDCDDVQDVYTNVDLAPEVEAALESDD